MRALPLAAIPTLAAALSSLLLRTPAHFAMRGAAMGRLRRDIPRQDCGPAL